MGLILDSSVAIAAERNSETVEKLLERIVILTGDQEAALSAVGLTELVHGLYRAVTPEQRSRRQAFINEFLADVPVHPYTKEMALLAGEIDAGLRGRGLVIPFADLLIGVTALWLNFSVLTINIRDFERIPGLKVVKF
jgi:predicted nucleic acid-binding protein